MSVWHDLFDIGCSSVLSRKCFSACFLIASSGVEYRRGKNLGRSNGVFGYDFFVIVCPLETQMRTILPLTNRHGLELNNFSYVSSEIHRWCFFGSWLVLENMSISLVCTEKEITSIRKKCCSF
jgi:hypothetical protein